MAVQHASHTEPMRLYIFLQLSIILEISHQFLCLLIQCSLDQLLIACEARPYLLINVSIFISTLVSQLYKKIQLNEARILNDARNAYYCWQVVLSPDPPCRIRQCTKRESCNLLPPLRHPLLPRCDSSQHYLPQFMHPPPLSSFFRRSHSTQRVFQPQRSQLHLGYSLGFHPFPKEQQQTHRSWEDANSTSDPFLNLFDFDQNLNLRVLCS